MSEQVKIKKVQNKKIKVKNINSGTEKYENEKTLINYHTNLNKKPHCEYCGDFSHESCKYAKIENFESYDKQINNIKKSIGEKSLPQEIDIPCLDEILEHQEIKSDADNQTYRLLLDIYNSFDNYETSSVIEKIKNYSKKELFIKNILMDEAEKYNNEKPYEELIKLKNELKIKVTNELWNYNNNFKKHVYIEDLFDKAFSIKKPEQILEELNDSCLKDKVNSEYKEKIRNVFREIIDAKAMNKIYSNLTEDYNEFLKLKEIIETDNEKIKSLINLNYGNLEKFLEIKEPILKTFEKFKYPKFKKVLDTFGKIIVPILPLTISLPLMWLAGPWGGVSSIVMICMYYCSIGIPEYPSDYEFKLTCYENDIETEQKRFNDELKKFNFLKEAMKEF
ncbi:MAG: hypothetical protein PHN56_03430 [Candidatus Nanoarchaeia archaeon]|nr:hypothetical protein [Candidatus Nanoarchaeia archaeon]